MTYIYPSAPRPRSEVTATTDREAKDKGEISSICYSSSSMADSRFQHPEQDVAGNGELPTYDALAAEAGPNSRSVQCPVG